MFRSIWVVSHKLLGLILIGLCWYQCHVGIDLYETLYKSTTDYTGIFWGITGTLGGLILVGTMMGVLKNIKRDKTKMDDDIENTTESNAITKEIVYTRGESMDNANAGMTNGNSSGVGLVVPSEENP